MGTIAEKLEYTLDSVNDIEEALKQKNKEFITHSITNIVDKINNERYIQALVISSNKYSDNKSNTLNITFNNSAYDSLFNRYNSEHEEKNENFIRNIQYILPENKIKYNFSFYNNQILQNLQPTHIQFNNPKTNNLTNEESEAYIQHEMEIIQLFFEPMRSQLEDAQTNTTLFINRNVISYNIKGFSADILIESSGGIIARQTNVFFDINKPYHTINFIRKMYTGQNVKIQFIFRNWVVEGEINTTISMTGDIIGKNKTTGIVERYNYTTTPQEITFYHNNITILFDSVIYTKSSSDVIIYCDIDTVCEYQKTINQINFLRSYASYITDIGKDTTAEANHILFNKKVYNPNNGDYLIGTMPDNTNNSFSKSIEFIDNIPNIKVDEGYYPKNKNIEIIGSILNDSFPEEYLEYDFYNKIDRKYSVFNEFIEIISYETRPRFSYNFFISKKYKDEIKNDYFTSNYYKLEFIYHNKNIFIVPMSPTDSVEIINDVPNKTYFTLTTTSANTMDVYIHSIIRIDYSTFLIAYEYETVASQSKTSGLYLKTLRFEETTPINKDTTYSLTWTASSSILVGTAANTLLSGSSYATQEMYFFPLKNEVANTLEIGVGKIYDNYISSGVHQKRTLYYNDIYRTTSSGALTLNSTAWTTLCSVAPSTTSGYHWCKLFPSKYGGITFASQTNLSNYTEKFVHRIEGRANIKAVTLTLNAAGTPNEIKGLIPLGRLNDGSILFTGDTTFNLTYGDVYPYLPTPTQPLSDNINYTYGKHFYIKAYNDKAQTFVDLGSFIIEDDFVVEKDDTTFNDYENITLLDNNILLVKPNKYSSKVRLYQIILKFNEYETNYYAYFIKEYSSSGELPNKININMSFFSKMSNGISLRESCKNNLIDTGNFVLANSAGNIYYSTKSDIIGSNNFWRSLAISSTMNFSSIAYGNGMFVAIANTVMWNGESTTYILYCKNKITGWSYASIEPALTSPIRSITYGNGRFVFVGDNGVSYYSLDGMVWTSMTGLPTTGRINQVTYGNGRFICVGNSSSGVGVSYYSTNGTSWTAMKGAATDFIGQSVAYGNGIFVTVSSAATYYSTNGTSWTLSPSGRIGVQVVYGNGVFVTTGVVSNIYYSTDGINWSIGFAGYPSSYNPIIYGYSTFIITGTPYYSIDGINWQSDLSNFPKCTCGCYGILNTNT